MDRQDAQVELLPEGLGIAALALHDWWIFSTSSEDNAGAVAAIAAEPETIM